MTWDWHYYVASTCITSEVLTACFRLLNHFSYCLYEPNDSVLMEYKGGLEKSTCQEIVDINA